MAAGIM